MSRADFGNDVGETHNRKTQSDSHWTRSETATFLKMLLVKFQPAYRRFRPYQFGHLHKL
ncbi:hypothetical protein BH24ACI1_BH24ACI1_16760 [soil metagenome]